MKVMERRDANDQRKATDAELFEAMSEGDLSPLGVLFDRHHEHVRQFVLRAAPNSADVDDTVQETFLTAARASSSFDGRSSARPFLLGVAAQLLRRRRRTFARIRRLAEAFSSASQAPLPTPEDQTSQFQEDAQLRSAVDRLSEDRRLVLTMVEWGGMSGVDVARSLDVPVGTVWRRLHEARNELRDALQGINSKRGNR